MNGEIVIAGIPGEEATVKTFQRKGTTISLIPANPRLEPMVFDADQVQIFGARRHRHAPPVASTPSNLT